MQLPQQPLVVEPKKKATHSVIWLHGLGADCHDFVDLIGELNLPSTLQLRFIFPNAPVRPVTLNAGIPTRAWYDIYSLNDLTKEDEVGLKQSEEYLSALIVKETQRNISSKNVILAGFSQGGATALHTALRYPHQLGGILALSTYLPLAKDLSRHASGINKNIPIFLAHGLFDDVLPILFAKMTAALLDQEGYSLDWHEYAMGHELCMEEIADISSWFQKVCRS